MLKRRLIPCLDLHNGHVAKGVHASGIRDPQDPVEAARFYDNQGADELFLFDVSQSAEGHELFLVAVRKVAEQTGLPLCVSGGVRRATDVRRLFDAGADKVAIGSAATITPTLIRDLVHTYGREGIVGAVDTRRLPPHPSDPAPAYEIVIQGGTRPTGLAAIEWCQTLERLGVAEILLTSMDQTGTRDGYDLNLAQQVTDAVSIPVLIRGGVGTLEHLEQGFSIGRAQGALAASIFHFGLTSIGHAKRFLDAHGIPIRPVGPALG